MDTSTRNDSTNDSDRRPPTRRYSHARNRRRRKSSPRRSPNGRSLLCRSAIATVETAVTLPVLFILIFGTLELSVRMMLRQSATVAAYETARSAARRTVTTAGAAARGEKILTDRNIEGGRVLFNPEEIESLETGERFRVQVRIPVRNNTPVNYVLPNSGWIRVNAHMMRE